MFGNSKLSGGRHIDVVTKYFYPVAAGIETNIMETYSVLAEMGWDVTIHTTQSTLTERNTLQAGDEMMRGLRVRRYPWGISSFHPQIDWSGTDLVCLHNFNVVPHLWLMLRSLWLKKRNLKNFGLIVTPHGGFNPEWSIFPPLVARAKQTYHYTLGTLLVNAVADGVRAVSEWEKQEMVSKGIRKDLVEVISNGIEDEAAWDLEREASPAIKQRVNELGDYLIQIGRIYPIKNYETTIRALPLLPERIKFVIVGPVADQNYVADLERLAAELGASDRVVFFGVVRGADKYYLIKHAQMMVHMAIWESFCNVVHEGLSQGLICIVANNTALPYLIKDGVNGYVVDTQDWRSLARRINFVLANQESPLLLEMKRRGREFGLEDTWRKVAGRMHSLYLRAAPRLNGSETPPSLEREAA